MVLPAQGIMFITNFHRRVFSNQNAGTDQTRGIIHPQNEGLEWFWYRGKNNHWFCSWFLFSFGGFLKGATTSYHPSSPLETRKRSGYQWINAENVLSMLGLDPLPYLRPNTYLKLNTYWFVQKWVKPESLVQSWYSLVFQILAVCAI